MSTELQIQANRENAKLSTGPLTPETKSISSLNALKTGLTGRTILLPSDDVEIYQKHVAHFEQIHEPGTDQEKYLVQSIADTAWRLLRIPGLEAGVYAMGKITYANMFADQTDPAVREALLQNHIFTTHRKDLSNIQLQEMRLNRQKKRDLEELEKLQNDHLLIHRDRLNDAYETYVSSCRARKPFDAAKFGFEFSEESLAARYHYLAANGDTKPPLLTVAGSSIAFKKRRGRKQARSSSQKLKVGKQPRHQLRKSHFFPA